jgi:hypothetical protein
MAKKPRGRPEAQIDKPQLEQLMGYRPSMYDVSGFFKVSRTTMNDFIKKEYGMVFKEFRATYQSKMKLNLIQKAIFKAQNGDNEMIKFCLINLGGWTNGNRERSDFDEDDFIEDIEWVD